MEAHSQGPGMATNYRSLHDHIHAFVTFLSKLARTVQEIDQLDTVHTKALIEQALELATRIQKEPLLSKLMSKMESLERVVELQYNQNRKIGEDLAGLGKSVNTPSPSRSAWNPLPQITLPLPQLPIPAYNKDHRILIKIEHKPGSMSLMEKSSKELTDIINAQLKKSKVTDKDVRMVKMLQNGNLSIQVVDNGEVEKLQANLDWAQGLGDASIITKSFGVVAHGVSLHKIDMKDKEATIRYLTRKNKNAFLNLTISWIGWLKAPIGEKTIGSLILEMTDPVTANRMIDEGIVTGSQMHACILCNPKCRMKQCFNCSRYGHKAARCQN